ncbi:MAG: alpha/beta fold hydrolase, partial [Burkholderiales bacterium]
DEASSVKPTVVLMPGMDGSGELFAPLVRALDPSLSTVVVRYPDVPGDYAAHEVVARAALPRGQPYVLLGESFSGPVAVSIAAARPEHCIGVILCVSFLTSPNPLLRPLRPLLSWWPPQKVPSFAAEAMLMGRFATPALRDAHRQALAQASPATLVARLDAIATVDVRAALQTVEVPVLYLRATEDRLVPPAAGEAVMRHARQGRIVDIEGPHFLLQAMPERAAREIQVFLESCAHG